MNDRPCCVHIFVSGQVQGVSYRAFTRQRAEDNGVTGWARNLADGRVEVLLQGSGNAVDQVLLAMRQGPPYSRVTDLHMETVEAADPLSGFTIG